MRSTQRGSRRKRRVMISKLIAHDQQLGGKDGYERREEEALSSSSTSNRVSQLSLSPRKSISCRYSECEFCQRYCRPRTWLRITKERRCQRIGYYKSRLGSCVIRGVLL